ncbi:hypothetical protein PM082_016481 [Marasmius tenuissimus]|nr:hypothetical protein PM082_016481 [Marasmius tenuissimus]
MNTLFLVVTHLLATFTLAKLLIDDGEEATPKVEWVEGSVSFPKPFKCQSIPRAERHPAI